MSHALAALLTEKRFPHMVLGVPGFASQVCWVDINHVYSGVLAAAHLLERGLPAHSLHRRAASYDLSSTNRLEGVRQGLERRGAGAAREAIIWLGDSTLRGRGGAWRWRLHERSARRRTPSSARTTMLALGCVAAHARSCRAAHTRRTSAVMTFDDYPYLAAAPRRSSPRWTSTSATWAPRRPSSSPTASAARTSRPRPTPRPQTS